MAVTITQTTNNYFHFQSASGPITGCGRPEAVQKGDIIYFFNQWREPLCQEQNYVNITTVFGGVPKADYTSAEEVMDALKQEGFFVY